MIGNMEPDAGAEAVADGAAGPGAGRVVSRPRLFERLAAPARVIAVSAPPGSGKTVLLRSWLGQAGLADRAAWVPVGRAERDPQQFWLSVLGALRQTAPGSALVRPLTAAPDMDGGAIAERLLTDLAPLDDRVRLVIDDVHELGPDALRQLELLVMRAPPGLRFVLAARHPGDDQRPDQEDMRTAASPGGEWLRVQSQCGSVRIIHSIFPNGRVATPAEQAGACRRPPPAIARSHQPGDARSHCRTAAWPRTGTSASKEEIIVSAKTPDTGAAARRLR
jgi:hypothetical protein